METPETSASRTSLPPVIILNARATQVTPFSSFDELPLADATTHGLTLRGVIIVGDWAKDVRDAAAAATPAAVVDCTNSRRLSFFPIAFPPGVVRLKPDATRSTLRGREDRCGD